MQMQIEKQKMIAEQQQQQLDYMKGRWNQQNSTEHYPERNHQSLRIEQPRDTLPAARTRADGEGSSSLTQFRCRGQPQQHSLVPHNGSQVVSPSRSPDSQSPPRLPPVHLTYNLLESMIQNVVTQNLAGNITGNGNR